MHLKILGVLSIIAIIGLACTNVLNIQNMETSGRDAGSYHDISPYIYVFAGLVFVVTAWFTYHFHFLAGIIPLGMGILSLVYGLYLLWVKGIFDIFLIKGIY